MGKTCELCDGEGWLCENHNNMPWREEAEKRGCQCGAGVPCRLCNPCDENNPPRMPPGTHGIEGSVPGDHQPVQEVSGDE